ncbi:hypothetical protein AB0M95_39310 [Sphaerisporangium sp. NPDC051017]
MTIDIAITPRAVPLTEVELVPDLDALSESDKCSCAAGDDNPF